MPSEQFTRPVRSADSDRLDVDSAAITSPTDTNGNVTVVDQQTAFDANGNLKVFDNSPDNSPPDAVLEVLVDQTGVSSGTKSSGSISVPSGEWWEVVGVKHYVGGNTNASQTSSNYVKMKMNLTGTNYFYSLNWREVRSQYDLTLTHHQVIGRDSGTGRLVDPGTAQHVDVSPDMAFDQLAGTVLPEGATVKMVAKNSTDASIDHHGDLIVRKWKK